LVFTTQCNTFPGYCHNLYRDGSLDGAVLLTAGTQGKRSALKHSRVMIHQPMGGAQGQASDIEITAREIMKLKKELYDIIAKHSGNSYEQVERDADRDYWMTSEEAGTMA
jgi:ATP-dependent Clp protease protease subunit